MEVTCYEKISYYFNYLIYKWNLKKYKSIIVLNDDKTYIDVAKMFNSKNISSEEFPKSKKVIVSYIDEKEFNVSFDVSSYIEVKNKIKNIAKNFDNYSKKIKTVFPNFIENIYFVTKKTSNSNINPYEKSQNNNLIVDEKEIKNILDECIDYESCEITFYDIALLSNEDPNLIDKIKVIYVKNFKKLEREISFDENKNERIEFINSIYK